MSGTGMWGPTMSEDILDAVELLSEPDTVCMEFYGREFVAVVWEDPHHGPIANLRFGSGRHHTAVGFDPEKLASRDSIRGVNIVTPDGGRTIEVDAGE